MLNEISNNSHSTQYAPKASEDSKGENVKEVFISLLQGLFGINPAKPHAQEAVEAPRLAEEKLKEKEDAPVEKNDSERKDSLPREEVRTSKEPSVNKSETLVHPTEAKNVQEENKFVSTTVEQFSGKSEESTKSEIPSHIASQKSVEDSSVKMEHVQENLANMKKSVSNNTESTKAQVPQTENPVKNVAAENVAPTAKVENTDVALTQQEVLDTEVAAAKQKVSPESKNAGGSLEEYKKVFKDISEKVKEILPEESTESQNEVAKALFNTLVQNGNAQAALQTEQAKLAGEMPANLLPVFRAFQEGNAGELKSLLGIKSDVDASTLAGKGLTEKTLTFGKTARMEAGSEVKQQSYVEKVKEVLARMAQTKTTDSVTVKIDPAHLGEITVKIVQKGKEVYAKLSAESAEVEQVLRSKASEINGILQNLGYKADEVHVSIGKDAEETPLFSSTFSDNQRGTWGGSEERKNFVMQSVSAKNVEMSMGTAPFASGAAVVDNGWVA